LKTAKNKPVRAQPRRPSQHERKSEILEQAVQLINERGFANLSLGDIADAIGIKREGLYYYYKNRFDILLAIVKPTAEELVEGLRAILKEPISPRDKLRRAIENHLVRFERAHVQTRIALRDTYFQEDEAMLNKMRPIWESYGDLWIKLVREGQKDKVFRGDIDARVVAFGILGMCNWISRWYNPKKRIGVRELIDSYSSLIIDGIEKNAPHSPRA
jgi:TetR/AcrR family transcriptional regulator, cholesterol catabolism regulator